MSEDDEIVRRVEDALAGIRPPPFRINAWVKDKKNRVGRIIGVGTQKKRKWARVEFATMNRKGVMNKKVRSIWFDELRST